MAILSINEVLKLLTAFLDEHKENLILDKKASKLEESPMTCKILYADTDSYFQFEYPIITNGKYLCNFSYSPDEQGNIAGKSFTAGITDKKHISNSLILWFNIATERKKLLQQLSESDTNYTINSTNNRSESIKNSYLSSIFIDNFYCIKNLNINNLANKKEIYFLGENGDGKTLLLQAIVLCLTKFFFGTDSPKGDVANIWDLLKNLEASAHILHSDNQEIYNINQKAYWLPNIFAYGVFRNQTNEELDPYGFLTLFDKKKRLIYPVEWLKDTKLSEIEADYKGIGTAKAIELLEHLTDNNLKISIKGPNVSFNERGFDINFEQLSEGYRSVLIWVTDLVARLSEQQPDFKTISNPDGSVSYDFQAIVLVDEINLHLHPKWEYKIVRKLRAWFPNIQFFFSSHSPMTILGASDDAVFYRLYKENGITHISEPYHAHEMDNWLANVLITSPLFDMESARVAFFDEKASADTAEDNLSSRIRKSVQSEVARLKKESGKVYFSREKVQELIDNAIKTAKNKQ